MVKNRAWFEMMAERRSSGRRHGWIAVDLDGTMFEYHEWTEWNDFGSPIMPMVYRVRRWLGEGHDVRIFTARIGPHVGVLHGPDPARRYVYSEEKTHVSRVSGVRFSSADMQRAIQAHCETHVGAALAVTCVKDFDMIEQWDDRAIQVEANTGRTVFDEFEAEVAALSGKP